MPDLIQIVVDVDDNDVLRTITNHERLEKRVVQLSKEYQRLDKLFNAKRLSAQNYARAIKQVDDQINLLNSTLRQGGDAVNQLAEGMNLSGKGMRRMEILAQQAGYQLGDLAVQIQGGTNAAVALGQQGSQLLGFFGPTGALLGAGLAISTAFIAPLLKAKEEVETLEKQTLSSLEVIEKKAKAIHLGVSEEEVAFIDRLTIAQQDYEAALKNYNDAKSLMVKSGQMTAQEIEDALYSDAEAMEAARVAASQANTEYQKFIATRTSLLEGADINAFGGLGDDRYSPEAIAEAARREQEAMMAGVEVMTSAVNAYMDAHESGLAELVKNQKELNDLAEEMSTRLGIGFSAALKIIRDAKAEAMVPLSAFGDGGDYRYDLSSTVKPDKPKKTRSGGKSPAEKLEDYLKAAEAEVALRIKQVGLTEAQARAIELETKFLEAKAPLDQERINSLVKEEEALRKLTKAEEERKSLSDSISGHIENAFMAMVDGSKSVEDAMKAMIRNIILDIYRQMVVKQFLSFFGFANGGVFKNGNVTAFADGGVVGSPTYFPMAGGKAGLMGEAGPEAIMPLKRGPNGKLGVVAEGGSGAVNIVQHFNFSANGDESVKRIIKQQLPDITNATKAAVADSKRRGGAYGRAFN